MSALHLLQSLDFATLIMLLWWMVLLEIPRYVLGALIAPSVALWWRRSHSLNADLTVSIVLAGHNEERSLRKCLDSLREQTVHRLLRDIQIVVVDDGSTDRMREVAFELRDEGKCDLVLGLDQRGGKSAAVNLGISASRGDIVIIADVDTTLDRDALAVMASYFSDPSVGAVGGNLGVRNAASSLMTRCQVIEYAIGLSLGRCVADALGTLTIISGAFGAFRRTAFDSVGGQDVEVGEDADLTMKLRRAGWRLRFAPEAYALTDVPESIPAFIAQRLRWDRGLVTIWARKFRQSVNPLQVQAGFRFKNALAVLDVLFFQVVVAFVFPAYLLWLFYYFGGFATTLLGATLIVYAVLNLLVFAAALISGFRVPLSAILYLPAYTALQLMLIRPIRMVALLQELIFRSSYRDSYVPSNVMRQVEIV